MRVIPLAIGMILLLHSAAVPSLVAQTGAGVELSFGSAAPGGRMNEIQDPGRFLAVAAERAGGPGWQFRGTVGYAKFRADRRQHSPYTDAPWLPFDTQLLSVAVQWIRMVHAGAFSLAPLWGVGLDYFSSPRVYGLDLARPREFREIYPAAEAGIEVAWSPSGRFEVFGSGRWHVLLTRADESEGVFEAAGARAGDEDGTHWLACLPMGLGFRLRF